MNFKEYVQYTYKRPEGDLEVYAESLEGAIETMKAHGFTKIDPKKLQRTGKTLKEYLANAKEVAE